MSINVVRPRQVHYLTGEGKPQNSLAPRENSTDSTSNDQLENKSATIKSTQNTNDVETKLSSNNEHELKLKPDDDQSKTVSKKNKY